MSQKSYVDQTVVLHCIVHISIPAYDWPLPETHIWLLNFDVNKYYCRFLGQDQLCRTWSMNCGASNQYQYTVPGLQALNECFIKNDFVCALCYIHLWLETIYSELNITQMFMLFCTIWKSLVMQWVQGYGYRMHRCFQSFEPLNNFLLFCPFFHNRYNKFRLHGNLC